MPKTFGLNTKQFKKGYFPYLFNNKRNRNYIGKMPPMNDFGPDQMTSRDRDIFIFWYYEQVNNNYVWNHRRETYEYCKSDVDTFLF